MNILFTICGRAGSKGIKNKNIKDFCGFPLPYYTLSAIDLFCRANHQYQIDVVVNSDSIELLNMMRNNPFLEVSMLNRESSLGGDSVPKIAVIFDSFKRMEQDTQKKYDMVVDLDITSPLRRVKDIENLLETHVRTQADVTTSVTESRRNPYFNMVKKADNGYKRVIESSFTARQQAPQIYDMNASLYAYKPVFLFSGKGILDGHCECIFMYDTGILDLDHENDFELMQVIAEYLFNKNSEFSEIKQNISVKKTR